MSYQSYQFIESTLSEKETIDASSWALETTRNAFYIDVVKITT